MLEDNLEDRFSQFDKDALQALHASLSLLEQQNKAQGDNSFSPTAVLLLAEVISEGNARGITFHSTTEA